MSTLVDAPSAETPGADEIEQRRQVLRLSGWGQPFRFRQPKNPMFWAFVTLTAWGTIQMFRQWSHVSLGVGAVVSGIVLLAVYGVILGLVFRNVDRYDGQPARLLTAAFIWGATTAVFGMAIPANEALEGLYGKLLGQAAATDWSAALSAPFVEETAKGAGFLILLGMASHRIRSLSDALLVGAFIGLGFEILEDLLYTFNAAVTAGDADQVGAAIQMVFVRSGSGIFSHALFTALFSAGLLCLTGTPALARNVRRGVLLIVAAVGSHAVWDGAGAIANGGSGAVVVMVAIIALGAAALVYAFRRAAAQDRTWLRAVLAPEVTGGALSQAELDAAAGTHREIRGYVKSPDGAGTRRARRNRKRLVRSCRELSRALARAGGDDSPDVKKARQRIAALRA